MTAARHSTGWAPAVAYSNGRFLVAWTDQVSGNVMTQIINGISPGQVTTPQAIWRGSSVNPPALAAGLTSPPVVVWTTGDTVAMRVLGDDWTLDESRPVWSLDGLPGDLKTIRSVKIAKMSHSREPYLVTWVRDDTVFGKIINVKSSGDVTVGPLIQISPSFATSGSIDVTFDYIKPSELPEGGAGQYFVVWATTDPTAHIELGIYGQFVKMNGELGQRMRISAPVGLGWSDMTPAVAYGPEATRGRILVVWRRAFFQGAEITAQRVNSDGTLEGALISLAPFGTNGSPSVSYSLALGQFLVTWGRQQPGGIRHPVGRPINVDGTVVRDAFVISDAPLGDGTIDVSGIGNPVNAAAEPTHPFINTGPSATGPLVYGYLTLWRDGTSTANLRYRIVDLYFDSDGDALLDDWETTGVDINNDGIIEPDVDLNLHDLDPSTPPSPLRKDVFLEMDWMDCVVGGCAPGDTHNHRPRDLNGDGVPELVQEIVNAFAKDQAPSNMQNLTPDFNGIVLHMDYGQMGGGNAIAEDPGVPANSRLTGMDPRRRRIFHYGLATHLCCGAADLPGSFFWGGRVGEERTVAEARVTGARTWMHELGHNFGLEHGGNDSLNYKPNFISIMNYSFAIGIPTTVPGLSLIDYAHGLLPDLDENALSEPVGLGGAPSTTLSLYHCADGTMRIAALSGAVDWNCDGSIQSSTVVTSVNKDAELSVLHGGADQWSTMFFNLRGVANFGAAGPLSIPEPHEVPLPEELRASLPKPRITIQVGKEFPPRGRPFTVGIRVANDGAGPAKGAVLRVELAEQVTTFDLGTLMPRTSTDRVITFRVPPACNERSRLNLRVTFNDAVDLSLPPVVQSMLAAYCGK